MITTCGTAISADAVHFSSLLHKGRYRVPWHQRYYDWEKNDVTSLLRDIEEAVTEQRQCYFVGAVILVEVEPGLWEINDGQQRIVTVSLICAALCQRFAEEIGDSQREGLALRMMFDLPGNFVVRFDVAEDYTPRVQTAETDAVRYKQMLRGNTIGTNGKLTAAWLAIDEFLGDENEGNRWEKYFDYLLKHLEVACLYVPREIDPNSVFETINCRGKRLDELDLIRNYLYSQFNEQIDVERRNTVHSGLERIKQVFPISKTKNRAEEYVRCRMQCEFGYLAKDNFYRDVRRKVQCQVAKLKGKRRPGGFVFDLVNGITRKADLELYRRITMPTSNPDFLCQFEKVSRTTNSPRNITAFLGELKGYSVTHTLVFAMMSKYLDETDGRRRRRVAGVVNRNLGRLSSFVLRTAFVAKFEPSRVERSFAEFAANIYCSKHMADEEFVQFLRDIDRSECNVLDDENFRTIMKSKQLRGSQKIKSFLLGINRVNRPDATILNDRNCGVEHILPKGEIHWPGWVDFGDVNPEDWVHRIGNLTLLANGDNRPGGKFNSCFYKKKPVFAESSVASTRELAKCESWSPREIERRQREMAEMAVRVWSFG